MDNLTYLSNNSSEYIENLYQAYQEDPASVDFGWQKFFEGYDLGRSADAITVSTETPTHFLKEIEKWREKKAIEITEIKRPEL